MLLTRNRRFALALALVCTAFTPAARVRAQDPPKTRTTIYVTRGAEVNDPSFLSSQTTVIARGVITALSPPQSITNHPRPARSSLSGAYAWITATFQPSQILFEDLIPGRPSAIPDPTQPLQIRVYDTDAPDVSFHLQGEPKFVVGEEYTLKT